MFDLLRIFQVRTPLTSLKPLLAWILISLVIGSQAQGLGQQQLSPSATQEHDLGLALYRSGDTKAAIMQLTAAVKKNGGDWESWYYLGLARTREGDLKNARKAFEKGAKLRPDSAQLHAAWAYALMLTGKDKDAEREAGRALTLESGNVDSHYVLGVLRLRQHRNADAEAEADATIKLNSNMAVAYLLKSQVLLALYADSMSEMSRVFLSIPANRPPTDEERREYSRKRREPLSQAASALEAYLKLVGSGARSSVWGEQLKVLKRYAIDEDQNIGDKESRLFTGLEVSTKAQVIAKPEPSYTEAARRADVQGAVLLIAVFSADGKVENILVLRSLPFGLTEQSIAAAHKIKFIPGLKDGRPVSMFMLLEYNFHLY